MRSTVVTAVTLAVDAMRMDLAERTDLSAIGAVNFGD